MACRLAAATAIAACDAVVDDFDGASTAAHLKIYAGTVPAYADTEITDQTVLADITLNRPAFGNAAADAGNHWAEADLDVDPAVADSSADASGTAAFFRIIDDAAACLAQGTVGIAESGADLILNTTAIAETANVSITSLQMRVAYNQS